MHCYVHTRLMLLLYLWWINYSELKQLLRFGVQSYFLWNGIAMLKPEAMHEYFHIRIHIFLFYHSLNKYTTIVDKNVC